MGMNAMAITDYGGMFGAVGWVGACKKAGIKPIIGSESYAEGFYHRPRIDKDTECGTTRRAIK